MATQTLNTTEDARLRDGSPYSGRNVNDAYLSAGYASGSNYYSVLKVPTPTIPAGEAIQSVKLRLTRESAQPALDINLYKIDGDWAENTITLDNMPSTTFAKTVSAPSGARNTVVEIDITGAYDPAYGLFIEIQAPTSAYHWHSSESTTVSYRPKVVFETGVAAAPLVVESGPVNALALGGTQGPTISLGDVVEPPVTLLSGMAASLSLNALLGPTLALGVPVLPPKEVQSGWLGLSELTGLQGPTLHLAEPTPEPEPVTGEWFFEVLMPAKVMDAYNPTASLEVRNERKRLRPELKTLVRA